MVLLRITKSRAFFTARLLSLKTLSHLAKLSSRPHSLAFPVSALQLPAVLAAPRAQRPAAAACSVLSLLLAALSSVLYSSPRLLVILSPIRPSILSHLYMPACSASQGQCARALLLCAPSQRFRAAAAA